MSEEKLLRLEYDLSKTYTFALFAAMLLIAFGVIANFGSIKDLPYPLLSGISMMVILIVFIVSMTSMERSYNRLKKLYESES